MMRRHLPQTTDAARREERRRGLTIYEVVLSMAIFVLAMVAVTQLVSSGSRASVNAQLQSQAALRAETKMAEVVAGFQPLASVAGEADPEDERWLWSLDVVDSAATTGVKELTVTITHLSEAGEADASYSLKRMMRDPQLYIDAAQAEEEAAAQAAAKTSSSSSGSSSSGTGTGGTGGTASSTSSSSSSSSRSSSGSSGAASKSSGGGSSSSGTSGKTSSKAKTP
jgi:general secretion pathway protein I